MGFLHINPHSHGKLLFTRKSLVVTTLFLIIGFHQSIAIRITLYENVNKRGEDLQLKEIQNCTNLPAEWQDRTSSMKIYNSVCLKVFEHSDCKGRYVTLKASLHADSEYLDNLRELGFNDLISSVSPCALQIEAGRYVIQNLGDNKMLTVVEEGIYSLAASKYWRNLKTQQWEINQVAGSAVLYELVPVDHRSHIEKPVVFDVKDLSRLGAYRLERPAFLIESVDDWKYAIRYSSNKMCLATATSGSDEITLIPCVFQSTNQQWVFRRVQ